MAESDNQAVAMEEQTIEEQTMEEQAIDDAKNPGQQESAYGSLESSSQGKSQQGSYSGSKSLNSGSSHSSGFGDNADFRANRLKEIKHKDHKRKKGKEKTEKLLQKEKEEIEKEKERTIVVGTTEEHNPRLASEPPNSGLKVSASTFNCHRPSESPNKHTDQPTLVYTQALNYIRKIKERTAEQALFTHPGCPTGVPFASQELSQLPRDTHDVAAYLKSFKSARGFTVAISVQDGTVLQVSPAITDVLGFPKDMLLGQSFIDFVYPKDSINLSSKIIHGLNMPFRNDTLKDNYGTSFFCRMRMYHSLRTSGFGVRNKRTEYQPCKMVLKFPDPSCMNETASTCGPNSSLLLAEIIPIKSVYQVPKETPAMGTFSTRHSLSCNFSEYDPEAIPYLGHLPQDLTGNSIFDCYHPEDMPSLKKAYEEMVREQGKPHRSKPYRFRTFNGSWVTLQTEWLCFVNPWSKRIDSVIGQHKVLKGPSDIAIFTDPADKAPTLLPEEVMKDAQKAQSEILELLAKPVATYKDPSKGPQEMRRRTLAHMMSSFVDELDNMQKDEISTATMSARTTTAAPTATTAAARDPATASSLFPIKNIIIGPNQTSTVQKGLESVTSTDSPSTYGHLNYSETIHRFFRSHPKTISSDESGDSKMEVAHLSSLGSGNHKQSQTLSHSQTNSQSQSGSGSGDNCDHTRKYGNTGLGSSLVSSQSAYLLPSCRVASVYRKSESTGNGSGSGDTGRTSSNSRSYRHVQLTEAVLNRHNADMQKMFMASQRTSTGGVNASTKPCKDKVKIKSMKKPTKRPFERITGLKRPGGVLEQEASANKQPFLALSAAGSGSSLKRSSTDNIWLQPENPQTHIQSTGSVGPAVGPSVANLPGHSYPGLMQGFYLTPSAPSISPIPSVSSIPVPRPCPTLVVPPQPPTFIQPQGMTVPLQYIPGVMYQTVGPPLFNAPPLMLPNVVYQHTAVTSPLTHLTVPMSDGEKHRSGNESDHELDQNPQCSKSFTTKHSTPHMRRPDSQATSVKAEPGSARGSTASASGKIISSHSHVAESIRSYVEDTTILSLGCAPKISQFSQSTSVRAEAESIGSPGKQEKMVMDDREQRHEVSSDMVLSVSSSAYSPGEYKSTDDSMQNVSDNSELNEQLARQDEHSWMGRKRGMRPVLSDPPWLEDVKVTPELLYKYQLETKELMDVLRHDMDKLKGLKQPTWVDDQLYSLYNEMEMDGSNPSLHLEEGVTSSSGEDQAGTSSPQEASQRKKRSTHYFSKMSMLHEENAPMPPQDLWLATRHQPAESSSSSS
ncbi:hypothetical protein Pmani_027984 [Petrolisthes manimaculis]|uniref:Period circadian protein n=1 Tax=Petrolisthes manimaculis TaxID=1843537 RepID=A0AAE1TYI1_9EUCA|nr:hypothetical protein Pmani_027984 [Petrolisthes manimaculis]